jgi:hypothetical protein
LIFGSSATAGAFSTRSRSLLDIGVRRSWQIGADRVRIAGKHWARTLEGILARVAEGLGLNEPIADERYKLLICDQGSFFASHRDTEKASGTFATLVMVVVPSISTGGELVVRHKRREVSLAKSTRCAVVVRFSRSRRRYERQGLLVEPPALANAQRDLEARRHQ